MTGEKRDVLVAEALADLSQIRRDHAAGIGPIVICQNRARYLAVLEALAAAQAQHTEVLAEIAKRQAAEKALAEVTNAEAAAADEVQRLRTAQADDLRAAGWAVAVHNDYRLNGIARTFWLLTKGDRCVKGEGFTDAAALGEIRAALRNGPGDRSEFMGPGPRATPATVDPLSAAEVAARLVALEARETTRVNGCGAVHSPGNVCRDHDRRFPGDHYDGDRLHWPIVTEGPAPALGADVVKTHAVGFLTQMVCDPARVWFPEAAHAQAWTLLGAQGLAVQVAAKPRGMQLTSSALDLYRLLSTMIAGPISPWSPMRYAELMMAIAALAESITLIKVSR